MSSMQWPSLETDRKAMEQARRELGEAADVRELLRRAQELKDAINAATIKETK